MSIIPKVGIIGGTGFESPDILKNRKDKYITTPFGAPSDVLITGEINGIETVLLSRHGRKHDIMPGNINYRANIWALKQEGCTHILATAAVGSLQEHIKPGDLVLPDNFIDRTTNRKQTFYDGEQEHPIGVSHIPVEPAFCLQSRNFIIKIAKQLGVSLTPNGTVMTIEGPRYSSKAECNLFRSWGGDIIGMTLVPEVVLAKEAGICYSSISLVTDYDSWRATGKKVDNKQVLKTFEDNIEKVKKLVLAIINKIGEENWDDTINELRETAKDSVNLPK